MQTIQHRKSRIWEMKEDNYTKSLAKIISGLCGIKYAKYSGKCYTQIHKTLNGDAILVSLRGAQTWDNFLSRNALLFEEMTS